MEKVAKDAALNGHAVFFYKKREDDNMIFCKECGAQLQDDSKFCSKCGKAISGMDTPPPVPNQEKIKKPTSKQKLFGCLGLIIILIAIGAIFGNSHDETKLAPKPAANLGQNSPSQSVQKIENWQYQEKEDTVHNTKYKLAICKSVNMLNFKFPYSGSQHAYMVVRKNHDGSQDVMLSIEKGQFTVSVLGGKCLVRFDDNSAETYSLLPSSDSSTNVVFFKYADDFIQKMSSSKKIYIQSEFFQEGNQTMEFNVEGFKGL